MTQVVVNFLLPTAVGSSQLTTDPRVFDFSISQDAQNYYNYEFAQILIGLGAEIQDSSGGLHTPTATNINDGTIVFPAGNPTDAATVSNAINMLNNWSQMLFVQTNGLQTAAYGSFSPTTPPNFLTTDSSGNLLYPDGNNGFTPTPWTLNPPPANGTIPGIQYLDGSGNPLNPPILSLIPSDAGAAGLTVPLNTTMNQYMAQGLSQLISTLRAAGWDPVGDPAGTTAATAIANVTGATTSTIYNIVNVLTKAISASAQANILGQAALTDSMSIQQVLMVDYVSTGNQILFNQMQQLQTAVNINQQALSYLNSLQALMNQKNPQQFIMQLQDLNDVNVNTTNPQSKFDQFEQDTYNQALGTISNLAAQDNTAYAAYFSQLAGVNNSANVGNVINSSSPIATDAFTSNLASAVQTIGQYSVQTILNNLTYLIQQVGAAGGSSAAGGLVQSLTQVKNDFQGLSNANPATAIQTWIQDTQSSDPGGFQQNLSNAVVSSQSFNDTERETLREVMFVYEEFYKSATGLLSSLDTLLKKMADAVAH